MGAKLNTLRVASSDETEEQVGNTRMAKEDRGQACISTKPILCLQYNEMSALTNEWLQIKQAVNELKNIHSSFNLAIKKILQPYAQL